MNIVNWLLDPEKGGLGDTYTAQEVNRAIGGVLIMKIKMKTITDYCAGLLQTNAINLEKVSHRGEAVSCQALYPAFSFISHSCVANCRVMFR